MIIRKNTVGRVVVVEGRILLDYLTGAICVKENGAFRQIAMLEIDRVIGTWNIAWPDGENGPDGDIAEDLIEHILLGAEKVYRDEGHQA